MILFFNKLNSLTRLKLLLLGSFSVHSATNFDFNSNVTDYLTDVFKTYDKKILPSEHGEKVNVSVAVHVTSMFPFKKKEKVSALRFFSFHTYLLFVNTQPYWVKVSLKLLKYFAEDA